MEHHEGETWGHFRIERQLGAGGMGTVFAAWDELLERPVALKVLHGRAGDQIIDEARASAGLRHPNVVHVYGIERLAGRTVAVMELIEGESCEELLRAGGPLRPGDVVPIVRAVANALSAAHRAGRTHGDVKPSNILIEHGTERVLLADFGLSRKLDHALARPGMTRGTPEYLAPECALGVSAAGELSVRQDVYALAATAFDLLTGRPVFDDRNVRDVLRKQAYEPPPRPSELRPSLGWRIDAAILAGLRKSPHERTATPLDLAAALATAVRRGSAPPRVLLADDDALTRQGVALALAKRLGPLIIESASDGDRAYVAARERPPDIAVLDLDMPGMNGIELSAMLRSIPGLETLPILILSGCITPADELVFEHLRVRHCLEKPVRYSQLATLVRELLGLGRRSYRSGVRSTGRADRPTVERDDEPTASPCARRRTVQ